MAPDARTKGRARRGYRVCFGTGPRFSPTCKCFRLLTFCQCFSILYFWIHILNLYEPSLVLPDNKTMLTTFTCLIASQSNFNICGALSMTRNRVRVLWWFGVLFWVRLAQDPFGNTCVSPLAAQPSTLAPKGKRYARGIRRISVRWFPFWCLCVMLCISGTLLQCFPGIASVLPRQCLLAYCSLIQSYFPGLPSFRAHSVLIPSSRPRFC